MTYNFPSALGKYFNISCTGASDGDKFPYLCALFLLHFWRTLLFSTVFMVGNPFSVWIYHVTLPACKLSADKSIYHLLGPPLFIISNFSLAGFKTLCFSLNFENVIIMCLCRLLWVSFFWDILGGLQKSNVHFLSLIHIWRCRRS